MTDRTPEIDQTIPPTGNPLHGDRPIVEADQDLLGFLPLANALAQSISAQVPTPGLVIGLEGAWGSGKSSLLNLTRDVLLNGAADRPVEVLEFRPWLIGDRDQLLTALFSDLSKVFDRIEAGRGDLTRQSITGGKTAAEALRQLGSKLAGPGKAIGAFKDLLPGSGLIGTALEGLAQLSKDLEAGPPLTVLKVRAEAALRELNVPIVVAIDDVDRLEPTEAVELLRLVRSVADLPNVIYVLCYDHTVLSEAISKAANIQNGPAYLEKIIQVVVETPAPEGYDLRYWFSREVRELVGPLSSEQAARLDHVIDGEGGRRLKTPRTVVRVLNSLRLYWPPLRGQVDPADFVWLHLIKATNSALYRWIEGYSTSYALTERSRASVNEAGIRRDNEDLKSALARDGLALESEVYGLSTHLPGVQRKLRLADTPDETFVWSQQHDMERSLAVAGRRLSSPDHYRLYFALAQPAVSPRAEDFEELRTALEFGDVETEALFLAWTIERSKIGVSRLEMVLNRLSEGAASLSHEEMERLWRFAANRFDGALADSPTDEWRVRPIWRLMHVMMTRWMTTLSQRGPILEAFRSGEALAWLSDIYYDEATASGRIRDVGASGYPILPNDLLSEIEAVLVKRLNGLGPKALLERPHGRGLLLTWSRIPGDDHGRRVREAVAPMMRTDARFLAFLEQIQGTITSHGGNGVVKIERYLTRAQIAPFQDPDESELRIERIAGTSRSLRGRALKLQIAFQRGRR